MNSGSDRCGPSPVTPLAERTEEIADVPAALYTLRAIVLGVAAVIGIVGTLAFVQVPSGVPVPADAAAALRPDGYVARPECGASCVGRAVAVRELDVLPEGLDAEALAMVARADPEPPMAATPPDSERRSPPSPGEATGSDEKEKGKQDEKAKGERSGSGKKAEANGSPGERDRDRDDDDDDDDDD